MNKLKKKSRTVVTSVGTDSLLVPALSGHSRHCSFPNACYFSPGVCCLFIASSFHMPQIESCFREDRLQHVYNSVTLDHSASPVI